MTLWLAASGLLVALIISIRLGVIAAVRRNRLPDHSASVFAVLGQAMPLFWLDIMLIIIFAVKLRLLPASGAGSYKHIILPAAGIAVSLLPILMRLTRSRMIEILSQDYIRTARAKGLRERTVLFRHALRNALIPVVTIVTVQQGTHRNSRDRALLQPPAYLGRYSGLQRGRYGCRYAELRRRQHGEAEMAAYHVQ